MLLFALAVLSLHKVGRVIEVGLQIASVAYGALLGVFLLGCADQTRERARERMVGMVVRLCRLDLYIWLCDDSAVDLVRGHRDRRDIRGWVHCEL